MKITGSIRWFLTLAVSTVLLESADNASIRVLTQNREATAHAPGENVVLSWSATHSVVIQD